MKMNLPYEKGIYKPFVSFDYREAWESRIANMALPHKFFEQYVNMIGMMAMDVDKNYRPKYMLGIEKNEAKDLVKSQVNSVTHYDYNIALFNSIEIKSAVHWLPKTRRSDNTLIGFDYANADDKAKAEAKRCFIWKEYVKQKLESKNFFWKLFHRDDVKAMNNFIKAAETVLGDINFTKEAEQEAKNECAESYYHESDRQSFYDIIENKFNDQKARELQEYARSKEASVNAAYNLSEAKNPENIPEGKRLVDKNLLKVGFVPRLNSLDKDLESLQKIEQYLESGRSINDGASVKLSDGTVLDSVEVETVKIAVSNNLNKLRQIVELPKGEREEYIKSQLDDTYGRYTEEQKADISRVMQSMPEEQKAEYMDFMAQEEKGMRYDAWTNMNQRTMEEINSLREANGIDKPGYTAPNLFMPDENEKRQKLDLSHISENVKDMEKAPRLDANDLVSENKMADNFRLQA
jgi:hypothetical protein